jgi:two-component system OmpR family response regulator
MRVLLIEDDDEAARFLVKGLGESGYVVDHAADGLKGLGMAPALILSARDRVPDRIAGLKAGGDDYLTKPFAFAELLARLEALLRRGPAHAAETALRVADLEMDLITRRVTRGGAAIELQPREFRVLEYLLRHANQVVTRTMLLENVWDYNFDPRTNVIDVHISRLRNKIDKGFDRPLLHTVRGAGYRLGTDG